MARSYKSVGLGFRLLRRDYLYVLVLWMIPLLTLMNRENLQVTILANPDKYASSYHLVAVFAGALVASLCVVIRRYALQMGGGTVARVWNTAIVAGIARDASFLALSLLSAWSRPGAKFVEQYLHWVFAGCWLLAAIYQQELIPRDDSEFISALRSGEASL